MQSSTPSPELTLPSRLLELPDVALPSGSRLPVLRLRVLEQGEGEPVLFLHGNPTGAYLWRNVMPAAARHGRALAVDLMGHGLSDKPDVAYTYEDHHAVLGRALDALVPQEPLHLVLHDWGGFLGLHWASEHRERVRSVVAMETFAWPMAWEDLPAAGRLAFRAFRAPLLGALLLQGLNLFVRGVLPAAVANRRAFTREARRRYREFYPTWSSRRSVRRWPQHVPLDRSTSTWEQAGRLEEALPELGVPMLWLAPEPGLIVTPARLEWLRRRIPGLELRSIGRGGHFVQEEVPETIAAELDRWLERQIGGRGAGSGSS